MPGILRYPGTCLNPAAIFSKLQRLPTPDEEGEVLDCERLRDVQWTQLSEMFADICNIFLSIPRLCDQLNNIPIDTTSQLVR